MGAPVSTAPLLRALVADFDGTLTEGGRPEPDVLDALDQLRRVGNQVVVSTGRILDELLAVFPDVMDHTDALVCENGAVLVTPSGSQRLVAPVPRELDAALADRAVDFRRGDVLIASKADAADDVLDAIRCTGVEAQLVFNRAELMVLPPAVTKGTGTAVALSTLGLSPHNAISIGDAENDHHLLSLCELAVCPANAVDALKAHADLVLDQPDGAASAELARLLADGKTFAPSTRWSVQIGVDAAGAPVRIQVAGATLLLAGHTGSGKSYLAGLVAEQLIEAGYHTLVVDPEGDHVGLRHLPGVTWLGGDALPPNPARLPDLLGTPMGSAVLDLSHLSLEQRIAWMDDLPGVIAAQRQRSGAPHWVVFDEAHLVADDPHRFADLDAATFAQYCFVTFLPDLLTPALVERVTDAVLLGPLRDGDGWLAAIAAATDTDPAELTRALIDPSPGTAVLTRWNDTTPRPFHVGTRATAHLRHWHKYANQRHHHSAFHFRASEHERTGATAVSIASLHDHLTDCPAAVIDHHSRGGDFSRWVHDVVHDDVLAATLAGIEAAHRDGRPAEATRAALTVAIRDRYLSQ